MAVCVVPVVNKPDYVISQVGDPATCSWVVFSRSEVDGLVPLTISAPDVGLVFGWGFGAVLLFWSLGSAIGAVKRVLGRL